MSLKREEEGRLVEFDGTNGKVRTPENEELSVSMFELEGAPRVGMLMRYERNLGPGRPILRAWPVEEETPFAVTSRRPDEFPPATPPREPWRLATPQPEESPATEPAPRPRPQWQYEPASPGADAPRPEAPARPEPERPREPEAASASAPTASTPLNRPPSDASAREHRALKRDGRVTSRPTRSGGRPVGWGISLPTTLSYIVERINSSGWPANPAVSASLSPTRLAAFLPLQGGTKPIHRSLALARSLEYDGNRLELVDQGTPVEYRKVQEWAAGIGRGARILDEGMAVCADGRLYGWSRHLPADKLADGVTQLWPVPVRHVNDAQGGLTPMPDRLLEAHELAAAAQAMGL